MPGAEEKSQKPREMVHRAQGECARWLHMLRRSRQGLPSAPSLSRCRAELHDAVMLYWEQIKRFRHRENIQDEWSDEPVFESGDEQITLKDIAGLRLTTVTTQRQRENPDTNRSETVTETEPWTMSPRQALDVYDQLDACAHKLGFDAEPVEVRKKFGYQEIDEEELPDDADRFGPQPVEVPGDAD